MIWNECRLFIMIIILVCSIPIPGQDLSHLPPIIPILHNREQLSSEESGSSHHRVRGLPRRPVWSLRDSKRWTILPTVRSACGPPTSVARHWRALWVFVSYVSDLSPEAQRSISVSVYILRFMLLFSPSVWISEPLIKTKSEPHR